MSSDHRTSDRAGATPTRDSTNGGTGGEHHDWQFATTFFFDYVAGSKRQETLDCSELAARIRTTTQRSKDRLPWLKLARFGEVKTDKGSLRHDSNVVAITGLEATPSTSCSTSTAKP